MIDHLFNDCKYKKAFVFKGGTSLSKSYHVIERFSEDIDLILDWRKIIAEEGNPWEERSKTKQDLFNKKINSEAAKFYENELVPKLNEEIKEKLGDGDWIVIDSEDEMVINFYYPQIFETEYLRSCVRLEIGPLAEWMPSHKTIITPFVAEKYPTLFKQKFYYAKGAHYETATLSSIELLPRENIIKELIADYEAMKNMIYGNIPSFDEILLFLRELQYEIHKL